MNKIIHFTLLILLGFLVLFSLFWSGLSISSFKLAQPQIQEMRVIKVIDGDTLETNNGDILRVAGIDCPETYKEHKTEKLALRENFFAQRAKQFCFNLIKNNDYRIWVCKLKKDNYNRWVSILFLNQNQILRETINNKMIEVGLARCAYLSLKNKFSKYYAQTSLEKNLYQILNQSQENSKIKKVGIFNFPSKEVFHKK
ncbi:thermonuclease family protein [Mycoplasmopsis gallopavonis]|uniref:Thermonuclease n=1 Tax=Mycoplasmopsis gallopavonis TaxID=76629 RepID=A0A449AZ55_9BACT|nr:thermonuclease family protein [Mycoplasmopsis gallopavonis]RIV16948.1 hypothetical protein D1113_00180 [Mycoplasmopsis gallopavonis]VEU72803.1 Thermonuclease precursor [Mycoplasmopsis gallopavonis]